MNHVEPDIASAGLFLLFACVASLGAIALSGAFPLSTRPELARPAGLSLIAVNIVLLAAVVWLTLIFGVDRLRWTSMVIAAGFALLFAPGLFNVWPGRWRDGIAGLLLVMAGLGLTAAALQALV